MGYALLFVTIMAVVVQNCLAANIDCNKRPARVDPYICCPLPELISEEIKEKCKDFLPLSPMSGGMGNLVKLKRPPPPPLADQQNDYTHHRRHLKNMYSCFLSCALNATGIINLSDAKLNEEKLTAYLNVILKNATNLIPMVETSFKTCSAKAKIYLEKMQENMKNRPIRPTTASSSTTNESQRCPPFAAYFMDCARMESVMNCPSTIWSNTTDCNAMRDHMKQCKPKEGNSTEDTNSNSTEE